MIDQIKAFIIDNFMFGNESGLQDDTSFLEEGIIDSTGVLELVNFIEQKYQIQFADEDLVPENLDTINNIWKFLAIKQHLSN
ncbi:MAG: acyl carrier protein [Desulfobacteraceae bacterium]|nr:acyl carrier protein [Desulfobacteraceae bacterium]